MNSPRRAAQTPLCTHPIPRRKATDTGCKSNTCPLGKLDSAYRPWFELAFRTAIHRYSKFDGASTNYDGSDAMHRTQPLFGFFLGDHLDPRASRAPVPSRLSIGAGLVLQARPGPIEGFIPAMKWTGRRPGTPAAMAFAPAQLKE